MDLRADLSSSLMKLDETGIPEPKRSRDRSCPDRAPSVKRVKGNAVTKARFWSLPAVRPL